MTLKVKRKDKRLSYTITLGSRRQALGGNAPEDSNDLISGGFSKRRDDFPMVLQHDTPSRYTLMGGPLLNLKGELIGMNIARVNRAENYALPISVVQKSVQNILKTLPSRENSSGKYRNILFSRYGRSSTFSFPFPLRDIRRNRTDLHAGNISGIRHRLGLHGRIIMDGSRHTYASVRKKDHGGGSHHLL